MAPPSEEQRGSHRLIPSLALNLSNFLFHKQLEKTLLLKVLCA